jgi:hypothetical protein
MIKGVSKRVIVVNSPDPQLFEKAIFILRDGAFLKKNATQDDILREAQKIANCYVKNNVLKKRIKVPAPAYAAAGAAVTGIAWLCARFIV